MEATSAPTGVVARNTFWAVLQQVLPMGFTVFVTPYVLDHLGVIRYGLFILTGSIVNLLGTFDGGVKGTAQRYFGIYAGQGDTARTTKLLVTLLVIIGAAGSVASVVSWFVASPIISALSMPARLRPESVFLFRTLGILITLDFLHNLFVAILQAHNRFAIIAKTGFIVYIIWTTGLLATVHYHWGLRGIAAVFIGQQILMMAVILRSSLRFVRRSDVGFLTREEIGQFLRFGGRVQISSISVLINDKVDAVLTGIALNIKTVTYYTSGTNLAENAGALTIQALGPIQTALANTLGRDGKRAADDQFRQLQHLWVVATTGLFAASGAAAWFALTTWLGRSFGLAGTIAVVAMASTMLFSYSGVLRTYCTVLGRPGLESRFGMLSVVVNIIFTVPLVFIGGAIGVVVGTALGQLAGLFYLQHIAGRELDPPPPSPFRSTPVVAGLATAAVVLGLEFAVRPLLPHGGVGLLLSMVPVAVGLGAFLVMVLGPRSAVSLTRSVLRRDLSGIEATPGLQALRTPPEVGKGWRRGSETLLNYPQTDMNADRDPVSSRDGASQPDPVGRSHPSGPAAPDSGRRTKTPALQGRSPATRAQVRTVPAPSRRVHAELNGQTTTRPTASPGPTNGQRTRPSPTNGQRPRPRPRIDDGSRRASTNGGAGVPSTNGGPGRPGAPRHRRATGRAGTRRRPLDLQYVAPGRSALLHWRLVASLGIVGLVLGGAYAAVRTPKYTAEAQLYVGKTLSLTNTAAIAGLSNAATQIAGDYSRLVLTSTVTKDAAKRLGHPSYLGGTLSATQIPNSPQIRLDATADNQESAVRLANAGAQALVDAVATVNSTSNQAVQSLIQQYQTLQATITQTDQQISALQGNAANAPQVAALQGQVSADQLQANAIQNQYQTSVNPLGAEEQVINIVGPASPNGSDRKKTLELAGVIGLACGLFLGVAAASLADLRESRRESAAAAAD